MEERDHRDEEEYSFLQEVIKDEADSGRRIRRNVFRMVGYGAVFGLAASVVFSVLSPWISPRISRLIGGSGAQVEIPKDEEASADGSGTEDGGAEETYGGNEDGETGGNRTANAADVSGDYRQMLQSLNTTATGARRSLAVVSPAAADGEKDGAPGCAGVIVADNGTELLILSHILTGARQIQVTFSDGKAYAAAVKMKDENLGICVCAVERAKIRKSSWNGISTMVLGNSYLVESGDPVIVLGQPFGGDYAVGYGNVTADEEYLDAADGSYRLLCTNIAGDGAGSGVMLDRSGRMIGFIDQSVLGEGSSGRVGGYAVSDIKTAIELLSNGDPIPYVGIYGMNVTKKLKKKGMPAGMYVKEVAPNSPAMAAGIQSGDVIVGAGKDEITGQTRYHDILMQSKEGEILQLHGLRQGAGDEYVEIDFKVTVGSRRK